MPLKQDEHVFTVMVRMCSCSCQPAVVRVCATKPYKMALAMTQNSGPMLALATIYAAALLAASRLHAYTYICDIVSRIPPVLSSLP